jgi:hypothetical protein
MADDGAPEFTKSTPNPTSSEDYAGKDEALRRSVTLYSYTDMRGNYWMVNWTGKAWAATPTAATVAAYKGFVDDKGDPIVASKRMFSAASDAGMLIDGIEERIELARMNAAKSSGIPWWLWLLVGYAVLKKGNRR